jgi:hypothetical protein
MRAKSWSKSNGAVSTKFLVILVVFLALLSACSSNWVLVTPLNGRSGHYYVDIGPGRLDQTNCNLPIPPIATCMTHAEKNPSLRGYCQRLKGEPTPCAMEIIREQLKEEGLCSEGFQFVRRMPDLEGGAVGFLIDCAHPQSSTISAP